MYFNLLTSKNKTLDALQTLKETLLTNRKMKGKRSYRSN
jgi:hypothetical protein